MTRAHCLAIHLVRTGPLYALQLGLSRGCLLQGRWDQGQTLLRGSAQGTPASALASAMAATLRAAQPLATLVRCCCLHVRQK